MYMFMFNISCRVGVIDDAIVHHRWLTDITMLSLHRDPLRSVSHTAASTKLSKFTQPRTDELDTCIVCLHCRMQTVRVLTKIGLHADGVCGHF